jgi:hypothetical protein
MIGTVTCASEFFVVLLTYDGLDRSIAHGNSEPSWMRRKAERFGANWGVYSAKIM